MIGVTVLVFWPVTSAQFTTWDDLATVGQNPRLESVSWDAVRYYWRHPAMDLYIPATYTFWAALAWLPQGSPVPAAPASSLNPTIFHAANLALHALSVLVVFGILRRALRDHRAALAGALFFALHPVQVESVAWVSGLKDVLSGLLTLVSFYGFIEAITAEDRARARRWFVASTLTFALALLAKPAAMVLPLLALILAWLMFERPFLGTLRRLAPWVAMSLACAVVAAVVQPATHVIAVPIWQRPFVAADALLFQLRQVLLPLNLTVDYGRTPQLVLAHASGYIASIVAIALGAALWFFRQRVPLVWTGALVFCAAILPVLGLVPFDFQRYSTVADHYLYVAMLGPALIAGVTLRAAPRWATAVACVVLALLGAASYVQAQTWRTSRTLYTHMIDVNPRSFLGHNNLGYEIAASGALADAIPHYQEAIRLFPDYRDANYNLAWVRQRLGDHPAAIAGYRETLRIDPAYLTARQSLASALAADDQLPASLEEMKRVLVADPTSAVWHANTGAVLARLGRYDEAIAEYEEALRLQPDLARAQQALKVLRAR